HKEQGHGGAEDRGEQVAVPGGGRPDPPISPCSPPFFTTSLWVRAMTSRIASFIPTPSVRGGSFFDEGTDPADDVRRARAVGDEQCGRPLRFLQVLRREPPHARTDLRGMTGEMCFKV